MVSGLVSVVRRECRAKIWREGAEARGWGGRGVEKGVRKKGGEDCWGSVGWAGVGGEEEERRRKGRERKRGEDRRASAEKWGV